MIMTKLFAVLASLAAAVAAQRIQIFSPQNGQLFSPGQNVTVSVVRPNSQSSMTEIGIGIAIKSCYKTRICIGDGSLGKILYAGPYTPNLDPGTKNMPNQNFTITIPNDIGGGNALLSVAHASFIGASTSFFTEVVNATLHIGDDPPQCPT